MTFAKHTSDRRSQTRIRPLRRAEPHPIQDLRRGHTGALVISLRRDDARVRPATPASSSLTVKAAATALSYYAGHALPAILLGVFSWVVAESLAGFAAYAEAMYPLPASRDPAETGLTETTRGAKPSLSPLTMQVSDASAEYSTQARPGARADCPTTRTDRRVSVTRVVAAWWSTLCRARERRGAIEELQGLDDRSLRDVGLSRCDIEHIVRCGVRRE